MALAEHVRLGLHPYEALGLEVEKAAGDWDTVRLLRQNYPLAADQQERRVCDGQQVLQAAREGTLVAGLPADLAQRLAPLDDVLDTYGDLLVADGVFALATGRADLANAAMEAAAGLGAPPGLRAIRTPRQATTVSVSAWALLAAGNVEDGPAADPARAADPAYAAALDAELGAGAINATDALTRERRDRFGAIFGGGENEPLVPSLTGGAYEGLGDSADADLRRAVAQDLGDRLGRLIALAQAARDDLMLLDPDAGGLEVTIKEVADRWTIDLTAVAPFRSGRCRGHSGRAAGAYRGGLGGPAVLGRFRDSGRGRRADPARHLHQRAQASHPPRRRPPRPSNPADRGARAAAHAAAKS